MTDQDKAFQKELNLLFKSYADRFKNFYLNEIVARGPLFSELPSTVDVLITSINPSYRKRKDHLSGESYNFYSDDALKDAYFKKFHTLFKGYLSDQTFGYLDLFYQRHTAQKDIELFLEEEQGVQFLRDQITLSRKRIQHLQPKIIFSFNRYAANFWDAGVDKKVNASGSWMGFTYQADPDIDGLCKIVDTGTYQDCSILKGTLVYFSTFLSYRTPKEAWEKVRTDIPKIMQRLS